MPEAPRSRRKPRWLLAAVVLVLLTSLAAASPASHTVAPRPHGNARLLRQVVHQGASGSNGASGTTPAEPLAEMPGEKLPAGFNTTQLPAETVNISMVLKGITQEQYTARSLDLVLSSVTANLTGTASSTWTAALTNSTTVQANRSATQSTHKPQNISNTVQANRSATHHSTSGGSNSVITSAEPASSTLAKSSHTEAAKAEASARAVIPAFAQCGGTGGECGRKDGQPCSDQAYSGYACAPGYTCNRENEWYWQCALDTSPAAVAAADPDTIAAFDQCGGQGGSCSGAACADAVYASKKCTTGFTCARQNEYYWQCIPRDVNSAEATSSKTSGNRKLLLSSSQLPQAAAAAVGRILLQQQQQAGAPSGSDLTVTMSTRTSNPQLVVYRLSQPAAGDAGVCSTEYCSRLTAAGAPVDSSSIQTQPTLAAMTAKVAAASGSSRSNAPTPAALAAATSSGGTSWQQQQQSGSGNGRVVGTVVGASVGGVLVLLLAAFGGRRIMTHRRSDLHPKPQYQDQPPVQLPMTQGPGIWQDRPPQDVCKDTDDTAVPMAVLQIRTSMSDQDWAKSATAGGLTNDQSQKVAPVAAAGAAAGAASSSAAAAAATQPRRSFSLNRAFTRSLSFTGLLPGRWSTSSGPAASSGELDPLAEPHTPTQEPAARTDQTTPSPALPVASPAEDDEHHDDFDPDHSARNSFHSRRNSLANRRSFGDPAYRGNTRNSGEFSAYRRGLSSYNIWAQGAVPTGADLAEAVQRNVNSRRSFQTQRGGAARSAAAAGLAGLRPGMHHSHSASDLTEAYASASSAAMAAGATAAATLEPIQNPIRSHFVQGLPSGTMTPSSVTSGAAASAAESAVRRGPFGVSSHALSGYGSGCGTPSSVVSGVGSASSRAHDVVISRSDAILTAHALAGLRSTATTPAGSTAGSVATGPKPQDPTLPVSSYALSNFGSGYNSPLARVSAGSVTSTTGPRAHGIQGLRSGFATPSSVGSAPAGTRGSILAPSVVAHALSGLESRYNTESNTPVGSVAGSLARDSAGNESYRRQNSGLASHAVAGLSPGCATPGSVARGTAGSEVNGTKDRNPASYAVTGLSSGCATPSDKASVYSVNATAGSAAAEESRNHIVDGVPVNSHALSGLASGCTTPGYPSSAAAAAMAQAGADNGVVVFNSHALSDAQSGTSSPRSRCSLGTLSYNSDAEYSLYRRGFSSYSRWLNDDNAQASDTAAAASLDKPSAASSSSAAATAGTVDAGASNQGRRGPATHALSIASGYSSPKSTAAAPANGGSSNQRPQGPAAHALSITSGYSSPKSAAAAAADGGASNQGPRGPAAHALSVASGYSSPKSAAAAATDVGASNQRPQGPAAHALSIASGYSSPKSAAAAAAAPSKFASYALSNLGSGTMTPCSVSTMSAYNNPGFNGSSLRDQRHVVDPSHLDQALSRYYSSVEGVQLDRLSQSGSRRNSTSSVVRDMATVCK